MIRSSTFESIHEDRMMIVGHPSNGAGAEADIETLRRFYPNWQFQSASTYLSAIAALTNARARAVLAHVDPALAQLDHAVAGLREAAGIQTKLVLCCDPATESLARSVVRCGADDYVLHPLRRDELDQAIGYARLDRTGVLTDPAGASVSTEELIRLSRALESISDSTMTLVERLADWVRVGMAARGATVVVEGAVATAGDPVGKPVLSAPVTGAAGVLGQVTVTDRADGSYSRGDVERLEQYASIAGIVLSAASQQRRWQQLAVTDECSGLPNRRYLHQSLDEILLRAQREQFPVTLLMFDVDNFKSYNDEFGHDTGDEIIRLTGELFQRHCREQDIVTRYGGDEFAVVFWDPQGPRVPGSRHPAGALAVLDRVRQALQTTDLPHLGPAGRGRLTISGGLATFPWDGATTGALIQHADEALLAAKRAGKNRIYLIGEATGR